MTDAPLPWLLVAIIAPAFVAVLILWLCEMWLTRRLRITCNDLLDELEHTGDPEPLKSIRRELRAESWTVN